MIVATPLPADARRATLEARDGDRVVARMTLRAPAEGLWIADRLECEPGVELRAACDAFATSVTPVAGANGEVLVVETPENETWRAALEAGGFRVRRRKAFVERPLRDALPSVPAGFALRSLADVGEATFVARLREASEGDPFEDRPGEARDPFREWRELVQSAGARFDAARWFLVDDTHGPVGVVLPQAVNRTTGTLYYVGVLPARRHAGLGRAVHALGLRLLLDGGLERYVGSTDLRNAAMLAVFARNGCPVTGTEVYLDLPTARGD